MSIPPQVPVPAPIPPPLPGATGQELRDALTFARQIAQQELTQIDRIHQRTVNYILAVLGAFLAGGGILGWIGFQNLKNAAINTATEQMQEETVKQVRGKLTTENINGIVSTQITSFVNNQLTAQVNKQIAAGPLHDQILTTAREQSQREVGNALAPRTLSKQQSESLTRSIKQDKDLQNRLFFSSALTYDVESENYEQQIDTALKAAGLPFGRRNNLTIPDQPFPYGVTIVYGQALGETIPKRLLAIFRDAGVTTTLFAGKELDAEGETVKPFFTIWVGPRDLTSHRK
jgi:hypothetical protein